MDRKRIQQLAGIDPTAMAFVMIDTEDGQFVVQMSRVDIIKTKTLLKAGDAEGEWPDEVNKIINRSKKIKVVGTINTSGDGWGWYGPTR